MLDTLKLESEKLALSWMQHEPAKLRDYLVAGVEDPRINLQSILSRHFLVRSLFGEKFRPLMDHECRFGAVMNWLTALAANSEADELEALSHALRHGADNAEGLEIPRFILSTFGSLPFSLGSLDLPNYLQTYLDSTSTLETPNGDAAPTELLKWDGGANAFVEQKKALREESLSTFQKLWSELLANESVPQDQTISVFEPACGSANDYRFLNSFGIARFLDYTGVDLCPRNIENAQRLFPHVHFECGNVFEINAADDAFEVAFVHDLFEHLSIEGLETAIKELCRVTRRAICANFFQMDEIPDHVVRPTDEYHWNLLSMDQTKKIFATHGFASQVIQIKSLLRQEFGCDYTHNPNAYTFILHRA
jgi:SAM-dependent methyltransferase